MVIEVRKIGWDGFAAKREKREKRGGRRGFYFQEAFFFSLLSAPQPYYRHTPF